MLKKLKKFFITRWQIIALVLILASLVYIILDDLLPIGPGYLNEKQIAKINQQPITSNYSFAVLADNKNGYKVFRKILKDIESHDYVFALDIGDLVYDSEKTKFRIFYNLIKNLKTPFLVAPGNHDVKEGGSENYFDIFGRLYYSFDYGNSLFIVLDSSNEQAIDEVQLKWLEEQLQKNYQHKFVFSHVPTFDPRPNRSHKMKDEENSRQVMALFEKYHPDMVFFSHIHEFYDTAINGINYIITGGAGGELLDTDPNHSFYHYLKININGEQVTKEVIRFPSPSTNSLKRILIAGWVYFNAYWVIHKYDIVLILLIIILLIDYRKRKLLNG